MHQQQPSSFQEACQRVAAELADLVVTKQQDYGKQNILEFGEFGVLVRSNDKFARLKNLFSPSGERAPKNESLEETWRDVAGYAVIAILLRRGWFDLPME